MSELTYREAVTRALAEELEHDELVMLLGEDIGAAGGVFQATAGLFDRFGERRVRDTPIAEQAIVGCALGAAVAGLRPVAEVMFADFAGVCYDQIANQLAKYRYMSGGQAAVPVTVRMANGGGVGFAAQHSQSVENWFLNVPGLKICVPGTPADAYGLLRAPSVTTTRCSSSSTRPSTDQGRASERRFAPLGGAEVVRSGTDVTLVASLLMRHRAPRRPDAGGRRHRGEVIDPRTVAPLDVVTVAASVGRPGDWSSRRRSRRPAAGAPSSHARRSRRSSCSMLRRS